MESYDEPSQLPLSSSTSSVMNSDVSNPEVDPMRMHTGENSCAICGESFSDGGTLKRHQLTHTGEKQHKCNECGKFFARKDVLNEHIRIHTGEKPYGCDVCKKMFGRKSHLMRHKLTRHKGKHSDDELTS